MHPVFANNCHSTRVSRVDALSRSEEMSQEYPFFNPEVGAHLAR